MFSTKGLFSEIHCPYAADCPLLNCIFSHQQPQDSDTQGPELSQPDNGSLISRIPPRASSNDSVGVRRSRGNPPEEHKMGNRLSRLIYPPETLECDLGWLAETSRGAATDSQSSLISQSSKRAASPTPASNSKKSKIANDDPSNIRKIPTAVDMRPKLIRGPNVVFAVRVQLLEEFYKAIIKLNSQTPANDEIPAWYLNDGQIKHIAVMEETEALRLSPDNQIYRNVTPHRIRELSKLDQVGWKVYLLRVAAGDVGINLQNLKKAVAQSEDACLGEDDLQSTAHQLAVLEQLATPLEGLEKFGYITHIPSDEEIEIRRADAKTATGKYVTCERCSQHFEAFPGRDALGRVTTGGKCQYHHGKTGPSRASGIRDFETYYSCCHQPLGTLGCITADSHVYKVKDAAGLASIMQFQSTPERSLVGLPAAVTFDCEMCYTTFGMELIRLTAIGWPSKEVLIDALVRPKGEILDLATRYSGVTWKMFNSALPYWQTVPWPIPRTPGSTTATGKTLKIISSPEKAREILFKYLSPATPLMGHALENDLNS